MSLLLPQPLMPHSIRGSFCTDLKLETGPKRGSHNLASQPAFGVSSHDFGMDCGYGFGAGNELHCPTVLILLLAVVFVTEYEGKNAEIDSCH